MKSYTFFCNKKLFLKKTITFLFKVMPCLEYFYAVYLGYSYIKKNMGREWEAIRELYFSKIAPSYFRYLRM